MFNRTNEENKIEYIPVTSILPSPYQPRRFFDPILLRELSDSIRNYGVLQPITVRIINGKTYELVTGERRWRAAKLAGLELIPAIIVNVSDNDAAIMALVENLQRESLNYFEEAEGYNNIILDYNITQEELAKRVGKTQSAVANKLRLLRIPETHRRLIIENNLSERHARAFLRIPDITIQDDIIKKVIDENLSVKKTEELIESTLSKIQEQGSASEAAIKKKFGDVRIINNTVKKAVELMKKSGVNADYAIEENEECYKIVVTVPLK